MELRDENGMTEREFLADYRKKRYPAPYLTADVVLLSGGRDVLLIRRKGHPFLGCLALPGGFVNPDESARDAAVRELNEETGVTVSGDDLMEIGLFSTPGRDPRGWIVSDAFLCPIDRNAVRFRAGDDAADALWVPISRDGERIVLPDGARLAFDHEEVLRKAFLRYDLLERSKQSVPDPQ